MNNAYHYILDSNAILESPGILAKKFSGKLIIPDAVMKELDRGSSNRWTLRIATLIKSAPEHLAIVPAPAAVQNELNSSDEFVERLSGADVDIVRIAIDYAEQGLQACVVTRDRWIRKFLEKRGIPSLSTSEFRDVASAPADREIETVTEEVSSEQNQYLRNSILAATLLFIIAFLTFKYRQELIGSLNIWGTGFIALILGVGFYAYRQRARLSYGAFEFFFGWGAVLEVFWPKFDFQTLDVENLMQIVAGIYVMVRGLDNIGKGVEKTKFEARWLLLFKKI